MRTAAALLLLLAAGAAAAPRPRAKAKPAAPAPARPFGTVLKSSSKISPGSDGPVFREGRVTILLDGTEVSEEFKATPRTKITLDGKAAKFKAAVAGALVLRADPDPKTKELRSLDLKSAPRPDDGGAVTETSYAPGPVTGEVANIDVLKGVLSLRIGRQTMRDLLVDERTRIAGESGHPLAFEAIKIGDGIDAQSADGRTATEILVRIPR